MKSHDYAFAMTCTRTFWFTMNPSMHDIYFAVVSYFIKYRQKRNIRWMAFIKTLNKKFKRAQFHSLPAPSNFPQKLYFLNVYIWFNERRPTLTCSLLNGYTTNIVDTTFERCSHTGWMENARMSLHNRLQFCE